MTRVRLQLTINPSIPPSILYPVHTLSHFAWDRALTCVVETAFDMGMKKSGHNVDRNTSEKITDGAREAFEKATGKKVNPKISN